MLRRNLALFIALISLPLAIHATDLDHAVAGDSDVEDSLGKSTEKGESPYIVGGSPGENVETSKNKGEDFIFKPNGDVPSNKISNKAAIQDMGYTPPGTFEGQANYIDLDKKKMNKDFRKASAGGINLTFVKDGYDYESSNDIINRTIGSGYKSVKGGTLHVRNDSYIYKTAFMNFHWSVGGGIGFNSGRGIFSSNGQRSDTTFKLWEFPIDAGLGLEIPVSTWFKFAGTAGPSVMTLLQDRNDLERGETGKRKFQFSPGYFASAQFKINLLAMNEAAAYDLFASSEITNIFMNIEIRNESYSKFGDPIKISGTSFGIGFTFEYL